MITAVEAKEEFSHDLLDSLYTLRLALDSVCHETIKTVLSTVNLNYKLLSLSMSAKVLLLLHQKMKLSSLITYAQKVFHYQKT